MIDRHRFPQTAEEIEAAVAAYLWYGEPSEYVGVRQTADRCPVQQATGASSVGTIAAHFPNLTEVFLSPRVLRFIDAVDKSGVRYKPITRESAWELWVASA